MSLSLTYFWLAKWKCILPPDDLAPQQPTPDERFFGGPDEGPWVRSGMQMLKTKTEVQTSKEVSFWFSPSSAGSCLLSLFLLWQKVIVSFLSSIFQGENLARTNMIDISGKNAPLWRDRDCRRASFPWQRHHCIWGLFILLAFQFLFNRAKKIRWFKDFQCSSSSLKRMLPGITTCLISDFQRGEHQLHHAPERN